MTKTANTDKKKTVEKKVEHKTDKKLEHKASKSEHKDTHKTEAKTAHKVDAKSAKKADKPVKKESKSNVDKPKPTKVEHGHLVAVEYVGTLSSGEEFDNSKNHGPIQFVVGGGQVIKGFDTAVLGMKVNESKKFNVPKMDAYGDSNPELIQIIPVDKIPEHVRSQLKAGGFLVMQSPTGQQIPVKIIKLDAQNVHLDMNHPLAGQDLNFEIKLVNIDHAPEGGMDDGCGCCGPDCGDGSCDDTCGEDSDDQCGCGHKH